MAKQKQFGCQHWTRSEELWVVSRDIFWNIGSSNIASLTTDDLMALRQAARWV